MPITADAICGYWQLEKRTPAGFNILIGHIYCSVQPLQGWRSMMH